MGRPVNSEAVNSGRNFDQGKWKDQRYIRCSKCGFICHLDRDRKGVRGSREGWGATYSETYAYDESTIEYDQAGVGYNGYVSDRETHTGGCPLCGTLLYHE